MSQNDIGDVGVYIINMDKSPQRLAKLGGALDRFGIRWERLPAVDGRRLNINEHPDVSIAGYRKLHGKNLNPAEVGCYLSHIRAYERFLASGKKFGLILEDDASFSLNPTPMLKNLLEVSDRWDVAKLSGFHSGNPLSVAALGSGHKLCVTMTRYTGSNAYLINRYAASVYLKKLLPMQLPFDHAFDRAWSYGLKFRAVMPMICSPYAEEGEASTISESVDRRLPWYQRLGTLRYRLGNEADRVLYGLKTFLYENGRYLRKR